MLSVREDRRHFSKGKTWLLMTAVKMERRIFSPSRCPYIQGDGSIFYCVKNVNFLACIIFSLYLCSEQLTN